MRSEGKAKALVLVACVVGHLGAFFWLHRYGPTAAPAKASPQVTQVTWIEPTPAPPPPMPQRPSLKATARSVSPPLSHSPRSMPSVEANTADPARGIPENRHRLTDQLEAFDLLPDRARFARPDPMKPIAPRLPGSGQVIVKGFHVRRERSPKDMVAMVGSWFGAYDTCRDVPGLMQDATLLHPERYDDTQRRALVERERRCVRR